MVKLVGFTGQAWEAGSMVQWKEPGPRSQELWVICTALPRTCASYSPLRTPLFEDLSCSAELKFQKSYKSSLTDQLLTYGMECHLYARACIPGQQDQGLTGIPFVL